MTYTSSFVHKDVPSLGETWKAPILWFDDGVVTSPQQKEEPLMGSVLRSVRDRKKSKRMGEVQIVDREAYPVWTPRVVLVRMAQSGRAALD